MGYRCDYTTPGSSGKAQRRPPEVARLRPSAGRIRPRSVDVAVRPIMPSNSGRVATVALIVSVRRERGHPLACLAADDPCLLGRRGA